MKSTILADVVRISERSESLSQDLLEEDTAEVLGPPAELVEFVVRPGHWARFIQSPTVSDVTFDTDSADERFHSARVERHV